jgi:hypothetical protein
MSENPLCKVTTSFSKKQVFCKLYFKLTQNTCKIEKKAVTLLIDLPKSR